MPVHSLHAHSLSSFRVHTFPTLCCTHSDSTPCCTREHALSVSSLSTWTCVALIPLIAGSLHALHLCWHLHGLLRFRGTSHLPCLCVAFILLSIYFGFLLHSNMCSFTPPCRRRVDSIQLLCFFCFYCIPLFFFSPASIVHTCLICCSICCIYYST